MKKSEAAQANPAPEAKAGAQPQPVPPAADTKSESPTRPVQGDEKIEKLRKDIAGNIEFFFPLLFGLTVAIAVVLIALAVCGFFMKRTMDATVLAASVQVAFGMIMGFVCIHLGLMMMWFGLESAYTLKGALGEGAAKLEGAMTSSSPGLLLALGGIVLIGVSLHKKIEFQENTTHLGGEADIDFKAPTHFNVRPDDSEPNS
jgi:hypothetical protein